MSISIHRAALVASVMSVAALAAPAMAEPGGCLKYGAVGAVGGHMVHHGVVGAAGGCVTGMMRRHEYRKGERDKAALWDKEHPADPNQSWLEKKRTALTYEQKATLWDHEHPPAPSAGTTPSGTPSTSSPQ
ncbi:hypothetical protein [Brytella acorum]|uniref:Lipoprotein n=1 Tax=Brytella acorum TaxID=2959299 RepID=A0AA35UXE6_9PROT|nr:hypothetical protein [Brytella acorum]MDF3625816.1 hypothetical protein [Brytella acorum]CAI9121244.1 hypothetical protein LMG32879_002091 [Brytella acorum]